MVKHVQIYLDYFDYAENDFIPCEWPTCLRSAVDVHHIERRGMGGDPKGSKDKIENLMGLCREHHNMAEHSVDIEIVKIHHRTFMADNGPSNDKWITFGKGYRDNTLDQDYDR